MKLLIEQDENTPGVSVTTDEEDMRVADAIFMVRLAEMSLLSFYLGGDERLAVSEDDVDEVSL